MNCGVVNNIILFFIGIDAAQSGVNFLSFANSACHIELNANRSLKMNVRVSIAKHIILYKVI